MRIASSSLAWAISQNPISKQKCKIGGDRAQPQSACPACVRRWLQSPVHKTEKCHRPLCVMRVGDKLKVREWRLG